MSTPDRLFDDELLGELSGAVVSHTQLMQRLEAAGGAARMTGDVSSAKRVERVTEFARLLGVRLRSVVRELGEDR